MHSFFASLLVVLTGTAFLWQATDGLQALTAEGARRVAVVQKRLLIPASKLETMSGRTVNLRPEAGKVALIEFIYTTCPFICQAAGTDLARVRNLVVKQGLADHVQIYSISFDWRNDRREELAQYGKAHGADGKVWTVARPPHKNLSNLLKAFRVVVIPNDYGGYEHNAAIHIVNQGARLVGIVDIDDVSGAVAAAKKALRP